MINLQLVDSTEGGYFVYKRNDYLIDEGVYSELYCALFATNSAEWLGDGAFNVSTPLIASRTENALKNYASYTPENIALIKSAVQSDCDRFTEKNPNIIVSNIELRVYSGRILEIIITIDGNTETYNYIWSKTKLSLENIEFITY